MCMGAYTLEWVVYGHVVFLQSRSGNVYVWDGYFKRYMLVILRLWHNISKKLLSKSDL